MSPDGGMRPNGLPDRGNCQPVTAGERLSGSAGMSKTERGQMVRVHQGMNRAVLGPLPPCCLWGFAFCSGAAAGEQWAMGSVDEPHATAIAISSPEQHTELLQPVGSFVWEKGS